MVATESMRLIITRDRGPGRVLKPPALSGLLVTWGVIGQGPDPVGRSAAGVRGGRARPRSDVVVLGRSVTLYFTGP